MSFMSKLRNGALALVALVMVTPLAPLAPVALAQGGGRSLLVAVQDADGRPLKQACVTFIPKDGAIILRKADAHGRVKLKDLATQSGRLVARVDGYEAQRQNVTLLSETQSVTFRLQPRSR